MTANTTKVIELKHAVKYNGVELNAITIRTRLKVKDLEFLPMPPAGMSEEDAKKIKVRPSEIAALVASLSELPVSVIEDMDAMEDFPRVMQEVENFVLAMSLPTGKS